MPAPSFFLGCVGRIQRLVEEHVAVQVEVCQQAMQAMLVMLLLRLLWLFVPLTDELAKSTLVGTIAAVSHSVAHLKRKKALTVHAREVTVVDVAIESRSRGCAGGVNCDGVLRWRCQFRLGRSTIMTDEPRRLFRFRTTHLVRAIRTVVLSIANPSKSYAARLVAAGKFAPGAKEMACVVTAPIFVLVVATVVRLVTHLTPSVARAVSTFFPPAYSTVIGRCRYRGDGERTHQQHVRDCGTILHLSGRASRFVGG